ncbi:unnamed protein product [Colletotrichum noveboracense]|uniref:DUF7918 domain-containing protein n=1 Tax=Colletotrichum noveboracense TaxID=2664923 RepID=A0A9W4RVK0_9PEZI|nr:hypothetical protein K456DRAFT_1719088 [Colletotrichum gloeosporioides 23]KAJ0286215.1 hypothetical protein COL940_003144 [Colletotrichum noveboracense]KAJ0292251.1 hypothetical protein CBS470a_002939 [Colletotrichum nupharicola]KAJ0322125.1 hypothetical protein Brms1b_002340 [Colletotrichum noveboracense]CAI0648385.1 unnamed protein product [Colletotrichum noveboracense]
MVVIEDLPQIRVAVRITGSDSDCVEYDDPDPPITPSVGGTAQHSVAKIIQSEDDAEFFVHYRIDNSLGWYGGNKGLAVACYIDGKRMDSKAAMEKHLRNGSIHGRITGVAVPSVRPGKITLKNFKFSKITRVENRKDKLKEDMEAAKHLGVIEVVVCRMVYLGPSQFRAQSVNFQSELAKKALVKSTVTHGTSFTEGKDVEPPESFVTKYPDGNRLIARYVFRYKSGTILENEGIIQRDDLPETSVPPRLSPLHDNLTIDDLSQEKIRRLAQERLDDLNTVKREEKVKREGSPHPDMRPSKVYKVDSDGAIDLTDE